MKIIIIDDDPTGSQTVHNCNLILKWDYQTLLKGLKGSSNLLFILANTRSLSEKDVKIRLKEICSSLIAIMNNSLFAEEQFIIISRGDSTLRGHNFLEPFMINEFLGPFDATFYIPAFLEGNRTTLNGNHFVDNIPIHKTIFAEDNIFGFNTSNVKELIYEQSKRQLNINHIENIFIKDFDELEVNQSNKFYKYIEKLTNNKKVILDITDYSQLDKFSQIIKSLAKKKKFLFRSAASFISSLSNNKYNQKDHSYFSQLRRKNDNDQIMKGLIVIGSHVELTTLQLNKILEISLCKPIEINVMKLYKYFKLEDNFNQINSLKKLILNSIKINLSQDAIPVVFTSREIVTPEDNNDLIQFQHFLSAFIAEIVSDMKNEIGYLISKGGLTTNTIISEGLKADSVYLEGQILPGISLVTFNLLKQKGKLPIVTFPGNIGNIMSLVKTLEILENKNF
tara:strand:+ start:119 stop:1474 length:1356 start_codon:yes stop_codon:yes gene_type:complete